MRNTNAENVPEFYSNYALEFTKHGAIPATLPTDLPINALTHTYIQFYIIVPLGDDCAVITIILELVADKMLHICILFHSTGKC